MDLDINLTKDSSFLRHALRSPFYWRILLKKTTSLSLLCVHISSENQWVRGSFLLTHCVSDLCCDLRYIFYLSEAPSPPLTRNTNRLAVTLFSRYFTRERTREYMGCDSTEHRGQRLEQLLNGILPCLQYRWRREAGIHVLYSDKSLKWLAVCFRDAQLQATVNTRCWHEAFVLYMMCWKSPMASHGRTLASVLERSWMPLSGSWISAI